MNSQNLWFILHFFTATGSLPFAMMARMSRGLAVKLFFQWSPLALWLHANTHHSTVDTSQPHCNATPHHIPYGISDGKQPIPF